MPSKRFRIYLLRKEIILARFDSNYLREKMLMVTETRNGWSPL
jgi:hypothetical protein